MSKARTDWQHISNEIARLNEQYERLQKVSDALRVRKQEDKVNER